MSADVTCAFGGQCRLPAEVPPVAAFLRDSGWPMSAGSLRDTAKWLQSLDVDSAQDFVGLGDVDALPGAVLLTAETRRFLQTLVKASSCSMLACCAPVYVTCLQDESLCRKSSRLEQPAVEVRMNR